MKKNIVVLGLMFLLASCVSKKEIVYLQDVKPEYKRESQFEPVFQTGDFVQIIVTSENPEVVAPYNIRTEASSSESNNGSDSNSGSYYSYLIDNSGDIQFPVLGKLHLAGLTKIEATELLYSKLRPHVSDVVVQLRLINFSFTVTGEVTQPRVYTIQGEKLNILQALAMAGDLTINGERKNVLIIRDEGDKTTTHRVDLTNPDLLQSPYYFLRQNDVVYVEPNQSKVNTASGLSKNLGIGLSVASLTITLIALFAR